LYMDLLTSRLHMSFSWRPFCILYVVVTLLVESFFVFKHLMARFKTTDIGCKWHEAALPQAIIPYCVREFTKLQYNTRNAWLFTNFIYYTNIFGYSTTQLFTMLFPSFEGKQFEGNFLSKKHPTTTEMCNYSAFKLH